jgi:hypothetical protein
MSKPEPPAAPNPQATAAAATGTNVSTAVANSFLNNVNQNTPDGSLRYDVSSNYNWTDPYTGQNISIPQFTATQTLSPQQQAIQDQTNAAKFNLAGMANTQSDRLSQHLATDIDLSNAPAAGDPNSITGAQQAATTFGDAGPITMSYGAGDFSADRQNVQDALMARMNPQLQIQQNQLEQRLADQGIRYGSDAYNNAMLTNSQQQNDARWGAISQAGQEQQRMMDEAAQRAGFENSAQQQQFQQQATRGDFYNTGVAARLGQAQSGFNAQNTSRNQYMNEQYALRNQPINEISSLLSGSQIQNPNFVNAPNSQIPTTDVAGLINNRFSQDMSTYQQQSTNFNSIMGGIMGLGAGAIKAVSDEREKENKVHMGTVFAATPDDERKELPIYQYSYKADPTATRHIGPMAQDVEKVDKRAVSTQRGVKYINPKMVMGSILRAA